LHYTVLLLVLVLSFIVYSFKMVLEVGKAYQEGKVLLIDKPLEWTSFDVVKKIRNTISRRTGIKRIKVGHAGTLDPLATGLLIVCTGKFTKRLNEFQSQDKQYTGTFHIGATTPSFDKETNEDQKFDIQHINDALLYDTAKTFVGEIDQVPPDFSAVNVDGVRAYQKARNNEKVNIPPRRISIYEFAITNIDMPIVHFRVKCSKGTYIRSLARDFGKALKSGAYLNSLSRTHIGNFRLEDAITIMDFEQSLNELDGL